MAKVNLVSKTVHMGLNQLVRFQLVTHCYINNIPVSNLELDCMVLLGLAGDVELNDFCSGVANMRAEASGIKASPQTIRNLLLRTEKLGLTLKEGKSKKRILLNPALKVQTTGNIMLNYKLIYIDPQEIQRVHPADSREVEYK